MINTVKHYEFFNPAESPRVHIMGCGALGSNIGVMLARLGVTDIHLWDFDIVESANVANQAFLDKHVGKKKVDALSELMKEVNPSLKPTLHDIYTNEQLKGIVFIAMDNIDVRKALIHANRYNPKVVTYIDVRMVLTDAQMYTAYFNSPKSIDDLLVTMDFTQEEAMAAVPVSACGSTLSVIPTVMTVSSYAVSQFIIAVKEGRPSVKTLLLDAFNYNNLIIPYSE